MKKITLVDSFLVQMLRVQNPFSVTQSQYKRQVRNEFLKSEKDNKNSWLVPVCVCVCARACVRASVCVSVFLSLSLCLSVCNICTVQ